MLVACPMPWGTMLLTGGNAVNTVNIAQVATTTIAPFRVHVATVLAPAGGWEWLQVGSSKDTLTKDGETITLVWGSNKLLSFSSTAGLVVDGQQQAKLQKLTRAMGLPMEDSQLWKSLPKGHPAKLGAMAALKAKAAELLQDIAEAPAAEAPAAEAPKPSKPRGRGRAAGKPAQAQTSTEAMGF